MEIETLFQKIYEKHKKELNHVDVVNKRKMAILFSSVPGAGKSTISDVLEKDLKAVRFSGDRVRDFILEIDPSVSNDEKNKLKRGYQYWFIENVLKNSTNGIIIFDFSIDRSYKEILPKLKGSDYEYFIISLDAPLEVLKERIKKKYLDGYMEYFAFMDKWVRDHELFTMENESEIALSLSTDVLSLSECVSKIKTLL